MNIDITVYLDGFHGDTSRTFAIGNVDRKGAHLLKTSQEALRVGIAACGPGKPFRAIGHAIHSFIHGSTKPESTGSYNTRPQCDDVVYPICSAFTGHGIGSKFHMRPWIIHTKNEEPEVMVPGDCFTIEPIILQTSREDETSIWLWNDGWTASTDNGARGAVFEHTVLITEDGVDILTG